MKLRVNEVSQKKASQFFIDLGMSRNYGINLEKKFKKANRKAMVLFPKNHDILHAPLLLFKSDGDQKTSVVLRVNSLFLNRGYNPIYFSRNNILRIREMKMGNGLPRNKGAVWSACEKLDSS